MNLSDVLAATFALSRQERHILFQTIAVAENWAITVEGEWINKKKAETAQEPTGIEPANNRKGGKYYKGESLEILRRAYFRYSNQLATEKEKRQIINETAEQLGRTYSGIYNQFHKMQNGQKK